VVRRFVTIALSLSLLLGLTATTRMFAQEKKDDAKAAPKQDEAPKPADKKDETPKPADKKDEAPKPETKKDEAPKPETKKDEAPKPETKKDEAPPTPPLPPIPPDVEVKLEAARRAVAEAIVAAQDAGLVQTTIDPPPILDILVTGRATDEQALKARTGVSPEVFGAWFTGYGKDSTINPQSDVRIIQPSAGLKEMFDQRSNLLARHIKAVRDAKGGDKPKAETKKADEPAKKVEEPAKPPAETKK